MTWIAGADGCRAGWFRVSLCPASGELRFDLVADARGLVTVEPAPSVLAVDVPIGLSDAGPRACDAAARRLLGRPRASSVFPPPIRAALGAGSRVEASRITEARDGRRVGAQAFGIYSKIREMDALLQSDSDLCRSVFEVHPEVSFLAWSGAPIDASKKSAEGRAARRALVESRYGRGVPERARSNHPRAELADDDVLDAFATLWTAERIHRHAETKLPAHPPRDSCGLPMEIVY